MYLSLPITESVRRESEGEGERRPEEALCEEEDPAGRVGAGRAADDPDRDSAREEGGRPGCGGGISRDPRPHSGGSSRPSRCRGEEHCEHHYSTSAEGTPRVIACSTVAFLGVVFLS